MAVKRDNLITAEDFEWDAHRRSVGCRNQEEYQAWCEQNGLRSNGARKGKHERDRETALYARLNGQKSLRAARQFQRHPETILRALSTGRMTDDSFRNRPYLLHVHTLFASVRNETRTREAFLRLLLHAQRRRASFESVDPVIARYTNPANTYAAALLAMARRSADWRQEPETWKPSSHSPRRQFSELARYLFCRYDAPGFLEAAWFRGNDGTARAQQSVYVQVGNGLSLRSLTLPFCLNKRMAHIAVTKVPAVCAVEEGWRWAQVIGFGGSERLARAIIATPLGESFREDDFWETVVRFFVDNPMLDPSRVGPLVDYLRHERYSPRPLGAAAAADRLPFDFTMKGRTPAALLTRMEAWHQRLAKESRVMLEQWEPSGISGFAREERDTATGKMLHWTIQEITTAKGLIAEGRAMCHCVATYAGSCARGHVSVWSLQAQAAGLMPAPERVMTIAVNRGRMITEARGRRNALPSGGTTDHGIRLSREEVVLLHRGSRIVHQWAQAEQIRVPPYLESE